MTFNVFVSDRRKGTVERRRGRYIWFRPGGSTEVYPKHYVLGDIRAHIAFVCLTPEIRVEWLKENER